MTIGSFGPGSVGHLYAEWLAKEVGARFVHVPFKGAGPAMQAAIGGQVDVALVGVGPIIPLVKAGKPKPLAVTGERRSSYLPDTPTFGELGLKFAIRSWVSIFAPKGVPAEVGAAGERRGQSRDQGGRRLPRPVVHEAGNRVHPEHAGTVRWFFRQTSRCRATRKDLRRRP